MENIRIIKSNRTENLDRKLTLTNGTLIVISENNDVSGVYLVVSFRDNKNKYPNDATSNYCSLVNLDNGVFAFDERCSRYTTVRRVLKHLTRAGFSFPYNPDSIEDDYKFLNYKLQVFKKGDYRVNLRLMNETK